VANFQDFLVSSSRDNTICVWNTEGTEPISNNNTRVWKDLKEAFILDCESPVISIMAFKEVLVSTSADGNARLWLDAKTNQILFHHTPANTSRCVWDENVVLGYMDGKMVATDENGKLIEFKGHVSAISDLAVCDEKLASSSYDLTILVWNKKGQCLNKFKNIGINPKQLMFLQGNVVAGCANDHICIWKEDNTFSSLIVVKPYIKSFDVFGNHIVTSASDGLVQLIDAKGKIYERLGYHKNIDTLKVFGGKIYIASPTGKITVVDYE
ncbi:MAG: hypothetical protein JHC93_08675, partial [Parachlamydiales bacterium]|nr:hypothetical protein [Parachlamydiales bacterium]